MPRLTIRILSQLEKDTILNFLHVPISCRLLAPQLLAKKNKFTWRMIRGGNDERRKRCGVDGRKMIGNYSMPSRVLFSILEMGRRGLKNGRKVAVKQHAV